MGGFSPVLVNKKKKHVRIIINIFITSKFNCNLKTTCMIFFFFKYCICKRTFSYLAIALVWFEPNCSSVPGVVCTNVMPPKSTLWTAVFVADLVDKFPIINTMYLSVII